VVGHDRPVSAEVNPVIDIEETVHHLRRHVETLTVTIGERSFYNPAKLEETARYLASCYRSMGLPVAMEPYPHALGTVANVVARLSPGPRPTLHYLLGAHYDSVDGTVGADDNASAVAVQLETARQLAALAASKTAGVTVTFVAFALEEPPAFATRSMGSRVYARKARETGERVDGMICLEMVGYCCRAPGCQSYPFPLTFLGYPKEGNFIGIVGNWRSRPLAHSLERAFLSNRDLPVVSLSVPLNGWILPSVRLSDHASFWDHGFQAVMVTDTAFYRNPHYHLPSDTMDTLDFRFMAELVESLLAFFLS
jgi:hypothetical protein